MRYIFFVSIGMVMHAYFLYPASIYIIAILRGIKQTNYDYIPSVTLIITAHNEEKQIRKKIENTLAVSYPPGKLQIIVASDGSTDRTIEYIENFFEKGVELIDIVNRGGKENAQRESLKRARGEIIVFTDVSTMLDPEGVEQIVSNFSDPEIGCVSSEDRVIGKDGKVSGENFYVMYEMWLRRLESRANTPVGLSGSFFAARKIVCHDFSEDIDSDFRTLLNSVKAGMRGTCDPKAVGNYFDVSDQRREFERKVRTVLRGLTLFFRHTEYLNIFKYGLFSYQYFCHKLLRWLVPFFLVLIFLSNLYLAMQNKIYLFLFILQILFYGSFFISRIKDVYASSWKILKIPVYFTLVNASIFVAWWRYFRGHRVAMWTPSKR
jgi:cellulose synthase/poly-beta-1,6-N-acetylglucosamine synthase-like glycosyltransferase